MKIYVLGHTGMLGRYVSAYLKEFFEVVDVSREILDASNVFDTKLRKIMLTDLKVTSGDVIINCIGTIKPRVDELGDTNAIIVNSVFPRLLSHICDELNVKMIHPTTDCIYTGSKGNYNENDLPNVNDVYGMSKALGEPTNSTNIRTSIIGEELGQSRSLVEWVKSNKNKTVNGYTNHLWNGITCLQFAKICKQVIEMNMFWKGTKHFYSNTVTKKELVELISEVYELNITVNPTETTHKCDRTLNSLHDINIHVPRLYIQLMEMKEFKLK